MAWLEPPAIAILGPSGLVTSEESCRGRLFESSCGGAASPIRLTDGSAEDLAAGLVSSRELLDATALIAAAAIRFDFRAAGLEPSVCALAAPLEAARFEPPRESISSAKRGRLLLREGRQDTSATEGWAAGLESSTPESGSPRSVGGAANGPGALVARLACSCGPTEPRGGSAGVSEGFEDGLVWDEDNLAAERMVI